MPLSSPSLKVKTALFSVSDFCPVIVGADGTVTSFRLSLKSDNSPSPYAFSAEILACTLSPHLRLIGLDLTISVLTVQEVDSGFSHETLWTLLSEPCMKSE